MCLVFFIFDCCLLEAFSFLKGNREIGSRREGKLGGVDGVGTVIRVW